MAKSSASIATCDAKVTGKGGREERHSAFCPIIGFYSVKKTIEYRDAILNGLLISKKQDAEC